MVAINPYLAVALLAPIWRSLVPLRLSPVKYESFLNERQDDSPTICVEQACNLINPLVLI